MKKIGIKLADGSFYPILEEGDGPKSRKLDLTTAQDNQTQVQIDLYRSDTDSIEGAEYVDTLVVKHLKKHPNGELDLHLSIGINENNELTAEVVDDETGKKSEVTCQLVSRTLAEREEEASNDVTAAEVSEDEPQTEERTLEEPPLDDPFSFDNIDTNLDDLPNLSENDFDSEFTVKEDPSISEGNSETKDSDDISSEFETVDNVDFGDFEDMPKDAEDSAVGDIPIVPDFAEGLTDETFDAPAETSFDEPASEDVSEETSTDDIFNIPEENVPEETLIDDSLDGFGLPSDTNEAAESSEPVEDDFDLPDFSDITADNSDDEITNDAVTDDDFGSTDDAFSTDDIFNDTPDFSDIEEPKVKTKSPTASGMDFSDLYDEETLNEETGEEMIERKTRAPVIICIVCAIICLIATALILFVVPSKYNLLKSRNTKTPEVVIEKAEISEGDKAAIENERKAAEEAAKQAKEAAKKAEAERKAAEEAAKKAEKEAEEAAKKAAEEAAQKAAEEAAKRAAEIIPVPVEPKPKPAQAPTAATYKIKWGDTLWDISESYYKNPWKYKKIATHNKIKNPDLIIAGKTIEIPEE